MRSLFFVFVLTAVLLPASDLRAQQLNISGDRIIRKSDAEASADRSATNGQVHLTDLLWESPEGQEALDEFQVLKSAGKHQAQASALSFTPGQTRNFLVLDRPSSTLISVEFTLKEQHSLFNIWVETAELQENGGMITDADIQALANAGANATPENSYNSNAGVIANNEEVFGDPPNVDGDGRTDILWHDIRDGFTGGGSSWVAGYFYPNDLVGANNRDIIYLDTVPLAYTLGGSRREESQVHQALAHEYQHLIFANYNGAGDETFVNEGLSEYAEVMNGFDARNISYLSSQTELALPLFTWRGPNANDYQRAGLFTSYLASLFGNTSMGLITRSSGIGHANYITTLNQLGFSNVERVLELIVSRFHIANIVNNTEIFADYGYFQTQYQSIQASGVTTVNGMTTGSSQFSGTLNAGAVRYIRWENVKDPALFLQAGTNTTTDQRRLRAVAYVQPPFGQGYVEVINLDDEISFSAAGNIVSLTLILPNSNIASDATQDYSVSASWDEFESGLSYESIAYDDGVANVSEEGGLFVFILNSGSCNACIPEDDMFANGFDIPDGGILTDVAVGIYYLNQFDMASSSTRNFELSIWDDDNGVPGNKVFSLPVEDFTPHDPPNLSFRDVDLTQYQSELEGLSGRLYVAVGNHGTDDNYIVMPDVDTDEDPLPSYLFHPFDGGAFVWSSYNTITVPGTEQLVFDGLAVPVRATFVIGTDAEESVDSSIPTTVSLQQNYPNPFNPSTTIRYSLPRAADVRISVFDLLGRRVAGLDEGFRSAGSHEVRFDGSSLTSGLYLYTLEAGNQRLTRTMTLLK